jgi:hypothetical protein
VCQAVSLFPAKATDFYRPISTYDGQGVAKKGLVKRYHAIAYTGQNEPSPEKNERPRKGEQGMLPSIRIERESKSELPSLSRINFSTLHHIQHDVKIHRFGKITEKNQDLFRQSFNTVLSVPFFIEQSS